jgi:hypothetical protein
MSREKQIEEMACAMCLVKHICNEPNKPIATCQALKHAERSYEANYRKQEWISVEERLPSESGKYICCTTKGAILIARFYQLDDGGWFSSHNFCTVTHWMPLPTPPKEKQND